MVNATHALYEGPTSWTIRGQLMRAGLDRGLVDRHAHLSSPLRARPAGNAAERTVIVGGSLIGSIARPALYVAVVSSANHQGSKQNARSPQRQFRARHPRDARWPTLGFPLYGGRRDFISACYLADLNGPSKMPSESLRRSFGLSRARNFSGSDSFTPGLPTAAIASTWNSSGIRSSFRARS
jgi:hypothetical protein